MKRGKLMRFGLLLILGATTLFAMLEFFPFLCPTCFGMKELTSNLYVEKNISRQKAGQIQRAHDTAKKRLKRFFPHPLSKPSFIACTSWSCYERFGGRKPRKGHASPKGVAHGYLYIKLSPSGLQPRLATAIMAHELTHTEIHRRLGLIKSFLQLPIWFDEGLAVAISGDPRYSYSEAAYQNLPAKSKYLRLEDLATRKQWQRAFRQKKPVYLVAAHHVRQWLYSTNQPQKKLMEFLDRLQQGENFRTAFNAS